MEDKNICSKTFESKKRKHPLEWDEDEAEEIEKKARLTIEEALSNSKIQTCPYCKVRATKGAGCNGISCVCGKNYCFRCGQDPMICLASSCPRSEFLPSLESTALKASKELKELYPRLTFKQCCLIVSSWWTAEDDPPEEEEWGLCDNDKKRPGGGGEGATDQREEGEIDE